MNTIANSIPKQYYNIMAFSVLPSHLTQVYVTVTHNRNPRAPETETEELRLTSGYSGLATTNENLSR